MPALSAFVATETDASLSKGERTAARILDAAEGLFAERGYSGTSLRDVAAVVGIQTPSLYNHFDSKESLYAAVLERCIAPVLEALAEFLAADGPTRGDSRRVMERVMAVLAARPSLPRLILQETASGGERLTPMLRDSVAPAFARAREMIEATPAAARWEPADRPLLVFALYHMVLGYFTIAPLYRELNGVDLTTPDALAQQTRFLHRVVETLFPANGAPRHAEE